MSRFSRGFERRLSRRLRKRLAPFTARKLILRRWNRRWLGAVLSRFFYGVLLFLALLFFGAMLIGTGDDFRYPVAALVAILWMAVRGLSLAGTLISEAKFSERSRVLLALPASERDVLAATVCKLRWQPFSIWLEFGLVTGWGFLILGMDSPGSVFTLKGWLTSTTAACFATLGVTFWSMLVASFLRWKLPTDALFQTVFQNSRTRGLFFWSLILLVVVGRNFGTPLTELLDPYYPFTHWIPLLGWAVRCFHPMPGPAGPGVYLVLTIVLALLPMAFLPIASKKAIRFFRIYGTALLATHWRGSAEIHPPVPKSKTVPFRTPEKAKPAGSTHPSPAETGEADPPRSKWRLIEDLAHQWLTEDQRRAMIVHLGNHWPGWTRKWLQGTAGLILVVVISSIGGSINLEDLDPALRIAALGLGIAAFVLGCVCLLVMLGGATPSRGLTGLSLGGFPLFAGWPIRVIDLIRADWKVCVLRHVAALPVCAGAGFSIGWQLGGTRGGAIAAVNVIAAFVIMTSARPMSFLSSLCKSVESSSIFNRTTWVVSAVCTPLVIVTIVLVIAAFTMLNIPIPVWRFAGIFAAAAVVLPALAMTWLYQVLFNRARISLESNPGSSFLR